MWIILKHSICRLELFVKTAPKACQGFIWPSTVNLLINFSCPESAFIFIVGRDKNLILLVKTFAYH